MVHALWITLLVLGLFYAWFAVANRYLIFLYAHLGATPFDATTRSRYWMAGFVLMSYSVLQWILGRATGFLGWSYRPPAWWQVWMLCALPLAVGIPWITMRLNWPTLPVGLAAACVATTLVGMALALAPGALAAQQPRENVRLTLYAMGIVPSLFFVRAVELPERIGAPIAYTVAIAVPLAGAAWLMLRLLLRPPTTGALAVLCITYLVLPLVHYGLFTQPDYRYITAAANFFAQSVWVQLLSFAMVGVLIVGVTAADRRHGTA